MKIMNKILAALLVLVMAATMIPVAFAEGTAYQAESGTTVNVNLTMNNISGFEIHWSDITYSNQSIITSVTGDGSQMNLAGNVFPDEGAFYYPVNGAKNAVFTLKFAVSGAVGQTCDISVKYKVVDGNSIYSREVTDVFSITIIPGHTHSYVWESDDNQHWRKCSCGDKISVGAHQWGWVTDTNPGEFTPGKKHEECSDCGRTRNLDTPINPTHQHQYGGWVSNGSQHWKECSCGNKISLEDHKWKWVIDSNPSASAPGKKHEECEICGSKQAQQDIPYDGSVTPSKPTDPTTPTTPTTPSKPTTPTTPSKPTTPTTPITPSAPTDPTTPSTPTDPSDPDEPTTPGATGDPTEPTEPGVQKPGKHGSCWIWWLLLLLIIAALLYYFYRKHKEKEAKRRDNPLKD